MGTGRAPRRAAGRHAYLKPDGGKKNKDGIYQLQPIGWQPAMKGKQVEASASATDLLVYANKARLKGRKRGWFFLTRLVSCGRSWLVPTGLLARPRPTIRSLQLDERPPGSLGQRLGSSSLRPYLTPTNRSGATKSGASPPPSSAVPSPAYSAHSASFSATHRGSKGDPSRWPALHFAETPPVRPPISRAESSSRSGPRRHRPLTRQPSVPPEKTTASRATSSFAVSQPSALQP